MFAACQKTQLPVIYIYNVKTIMAARVLMVYGLYEETSKKRELGAL